MTKVCPVTEAMVEAAKRTSALYAGSDYSDDERTAAIYTAMEAAKERKPKTRGCEAVDLRQKLRMIISHASGGHLSKPKDVDRSVNDICVEISRHKNEIYEQGKKAARIPDPEAAKLREALQATVACLEGCPDPEHVAYALDKALAALNPSPALVSDEDAAR